jgi:hypothetical protein
MGLSASCAQRLHEQVIHAAGEGGRVFNPRAFGDGCLVIEDLGELADARVKGVGVVHALQGLDELLASGLGDANESAIIEVARNRVP